MKSGELLTDGTWADTEECKQKPELGTAPSLCVDMENGCGSVISDLSLLWWCGLMILTVRGTVNAKPALCYSLYRGDSRQGNVILWTDKFTVTHSLYCRIPFVFWLIPLVCIVSLRSAISSTFRLKHAQVWRNVCEFVVNCSSPWTVKEQKCTLKKCSQNYTLLSTFFYY